MSGTYFTLNQKYNNLRTQDHWGGGGGGGGGGIYTAIGMVNITQYGASTALPDNTAFIQDAINAVAVGGTLYIPQGTFIILGSLTISTSLNIFGVGTIKAGGAMPYMLGLNASVDMFGGLTIDGDSLAVIGLRLLNTIEVRLNNVEIKSCTTGISSSALSSINLTIVDCLITDMTGTGISYQSPVITPPAIPPTLDVNNTIFRDCNKGISDILSSNIIVQGCIFDNIVFSISTGSFSATANPFSYNIMNNQFTRITGSAILINLVNTTNSNTTIISNNIFSSRVSSYTPINTIGGTFSTFNYDSPVLGIFGISSLNTQFIENTIEDMHIPETTSAIIMRCTLLTASFNNIGFQSVITGTPGVFIKCLDTAPFQLPILFLDRNVFKTQAYMELVGFPALTPPIPGGFVVPTLISSPCASFFDINTYSSGVDYMIDNTYETYAFTETFANTIELIVNASPTRIQFTNTSTAIGSSPYPTKIVSFATNTDNPLTSFVACDGVSFPNSNQMLFCKSGTYEVVYNPATDTITATRLEDVGITTFNAVISTATINLTSPAFYNSIVNFTGTTASTIDLPDPITNTRNNIYLGTSIQIFNNTDQQQIIQTPVNILGVYGSNTTTIPLPENSWYKLVVDGSNWRINERSSNLTYPIQLSVNTNYSAYDYLLNATTRFAPTTALTATIPSPVSASGGSSAHTTMNIYNNSDHVLTISTPSTSIDFRGKYGRGGGGIINTIPMPPHSSVVLYSNGSYWFANERSYNPTYFITLSSASTDASTFNYFSDATISISSTAVTNNILVIPPPNRNEIDNATITFSNTSVYSISLSITAGTFAGKYGSGTTTLLIPANTSVQVVTDGTNWLVTDKTIAYYNPAQAITGPTTITTSFLNSYIPLSGTSTQTITLPTASASIGSYLEIENINTLNAYYYTLSSASTFTGTYGSGGATTLILPFNSRIKLWSNGTSWIGTEISDYGWSYYPANSNQVATILTTQYYRTYYNLLSTAIPGSNPTIRFNAPPPPRWEGLMISGLFNIGTTGGQVVVSVLSSYSAPNFTPVPVQALTNVATNWKFPFTGSTTFFLRIGNPATNIYVQRTSFSNGASGGTLTGTSGSRIATITIAGGNTLNIGAVISIGGVNYTITGLGRATGGTCTGTAGSASLTLNSVTGFDLYVQAGMAITISGNEYLIIDTANGVGATSGGSCTLNTNLLTSPATTAFTAITGLGVQTTTGTYTLSPPLATNYTSSTFTIVQDAYCWVILPP